MFRPLLPQRAINVRRMNSPDEKPSRPAQFAQGLARIPYLCHLGDLVAFGGDELSIADFAATVADVVGYKRARVRYAQARRYATQVAG
jgi:hypothetical protein